MMRTPWILVLLLTMAACEDDPKASTTDARAADSGADSTALQDTGSMTDVSGAVCGEIPPADRARVVVVSHPFKDGAPGETNANAYGVFQLSESGELSDLGARFEMGRAPWGRIHFTPDGRIGIIAQDDGSLGVFRVDGTTVTVVHAGYADGFYAEDLVILEGGDAAYVLDGNWRNNGGGIFKVDIACDGTLSGPTKLVDSKLAQGIALTSDGRAFIAAADVIDEVTQRQAHLVTLEPTPAYSAGVDVFGDDEASIGAFAMTQDERFVFVADTSGFNGIPNRVGVAGLTPGGTLIPIQVLTPFVDPGVVLTSPFDNTTLIFAVQEDAIYRLTYEAGADPPFTNTGELSYVGGGPQLPSSAALIERGTLAGRVLVAENTAVRQLQFNRDSSVTDLGVLAMGSGNPNITGAIGVQP